MAGNLNRKRRVCFENCEPRRLLAGDTVWFEEAEVVVLEDGTYVDQVLNIRRSSDVGWASVRLEIVAGSANSGSDFVGADWSSPWISFEPGESSRPVEIDAITPDFELGHHTQIRNLTLIDDLLHEPDERLQLRLHANSAGLKAEGQTTADIVIRDDDPLAIMVEQSDGFTSVMAPAATDVLLISLNAEPNSDVVVTAASDAGLALSETTLTFSPRNWDRPEPVRLAGVHAGPATLTLSVNAGASDPTFQAVPDVVMQIDVRAPVGFEASPTQGFELANLNAVQTAGIDPRDLVATEQGVMFAANDGVHGWELWQSDGTAAGTAMVGDLAPGALSSQYLPKSPIHRRVRSSATVLGDGVLFFADDGVDGTSLFRSDMASGEVEHLRFIDTYAGAQRAITAPEAPIVVGDEVYFIAGPRIWKSDGTRAGTKMIAEPRGRPSHLVSFKGRIFAETDNALARLDVPGNRTRRVSPSITSIQHTQVVGDHLYVFTFDHVWTSADGETFQQIAGGAWNNSGLPLAADAEGFRYFVVDYQRLTRTDGTADGTKQVRIPVDRVRPLAVIGAVDGKVAFSLQQQQLWVTDGTNSTQIANDIAVRGVGQAVGELLVFFAEDGIHGLEPWVTDGTTEGTRMLRDIQPGAKSSVVFSELELVSWQDRVYFRASNGTDGVELWATDGTPAGTQMVLNHAASESSAPQHMTVMADGSIIFATNDGTNERNQVWITRAGVTSLLANLPDPVPQRRAFDGTRVAAENVRLQEFVTHAGRTYFLQKYDYVSGSGNWHVAYDLWSTDGTSEGTRLSKRAAFTYFTEEGMYYEPKIRFGNNGRPIVSAERVRYLSLGERGPAPSRKLDVMIGDTHYAAQRPAPYVDDYSLTATRDGQTTVLAEFSNVKRVGHLAELRGELFFAVERPVGFELWISNGTPAGTRPFRNFDHDMSEHSFSDGQIIYFSVMAPYTDPADRVLWRTDGTDAGTYQLSDSLTAAESYTTFRGDTYFSAVDDVVGRELWKTDGTRQGTQLVADLIPGIAGSAPSDLVGAEDGLYFAAMHPQLGRELWRYLPESPPLVADIDGNGSVDFADFLVLSANYGSQTNGGASVGDLTDDGVVDFDDFLLLAAEFGHAARS